MKINFILENVEIIVGRELERLNIIPVVCQVFREGWEPVPQISTIQGLAFL